jgi:hypothetical protein
MSELLNRDEMTGAVEEYVRAALALGRADGLSDHQIMSTLDGLYDNRNAWRAMAGRLAGVLEDTDGALEAAESTAINCGGMVTEQRDSNRDALVAYDELKGEQT